MRVHVLWKKVGGGLPQLEAPTNVRSRPSAEPRTNLGRADDKILSTEWHFRLGLLPSIVSLMVSDPELHARYVDGDRHAGGELCKRHFDTICAYFARRLPEQAEDLAQEVFVIYSRDPSRMTGKSVRAYFFGIARNVLLHALRKKKRHPEEELPEVSIADIATGMSTIVAEHEVTRLLLEALQSLSMIHQDLVEFLFFEGMSVAEAAGALGIPENTCRSRRGRAIAELRKKVEELELDPRRIATALAKLGILRRHTGDRAAGGGLGKIRELFDGISAIELRGLLENLDPKGS